MLEGLIAGLGILTNVNLILLTGCGVFFGLFLGAMPGLTATLGVALLLPLTFGMDPVTGQAVLVGVFVGGISGGLVSATLLGVPGTPSSIATTFDAFPMAKQGHARRALNIGITSSFIGGILSGLILVLVSVPLARVALAFSPFEYFLIAVFGITIIVSMESQSKLKAMFAAGMGLMMALVGVAPIDGIDRFTQGTEWMEQGFNLVPSLLGLFVFSQLIDEVKNKSEKTFFKLSSDEKDSRFGLRQALKHWKDYIRNTLIGAGLGILPGVGGAIANFVCYDQTKKASKYPEKFGTGIPDGIIASETGNNATTAGALVPTMTLGIPGDSVTAILLGGLMIHGIQPGPLLFVDQKSFVYGIFIAFFIANFFMLFIQRSMGIRLFLFALRAPKPYLIPIVMVMCISGVYAISNQIADVWVFLLFGIIGLVMKKCGFSVQAIVLGIILGPLIEKNLRTSLMYSDGSYLHFFTRPICIGILVVTLLSLWFSLRLASKASKLEHQEAVEEVGEGS